MISLDVVTITYNSEKYLQRCLDSVRLNRATINRYIVIDGGSSDSTVELIRRNSDIVSEFVSESDFGISDAFNKGISRCVSDFILLLNSDDWFATDNLEAVCISIDQSDEIVSTRMLCYCDEKYAGSFVANPSFLPRYNSMLHPGCIVSSIVYKYIGGYDLSLKVAMDYDFFCRCFNAKIGFRVLAMDLVSFRVGGISRASKYRILVESYRIRRHHFGAIFPKHEISQFLMRQIGDILNILGLKAKVKKLLKK